MLYALFYKCSGAHNKPTSDTKYHPTLEHQNNVFYKLLRRFEDNDLYNDETFWSTDACTANTIPLTSLSAENANPEMFQFMTNGKKHPLVIRKFIKDTKAVKEWCPDYFTKYSDVTLLTLKRSNQFKNQNAYTDFTKKLDCDYLTLGDSIKNMRAGVGSYYVNNVTEIFQKCPELVQDLELQKIQGIDNAINPETWLKINMFMGGPGTGSSLHCAVGGNFFFNVHGRKRWILIHPKYSKYLKSTPAKDFSFAISGRDMENPDGILQRIPKYEVILEPGDLLYVAPWWWHYVKNESDFTIACAVRDHTVYRQSFTNNSMFMLLSPYLYSLHPWILKILGLVKGRQFLLTKSMKSDKYIMDHLTGDIKGRQLEM